jgi:hypothetical protein
VRAVAGHQHDDGVATVRRDPPRRLDAADAGHVHVEQHDVGVECGRQFNGAFAAGGFARELEARRRSDRVARSAAEGGVVVYDQDAQHSPLTGRAGWRPPRVFRVRVRR